jgi:hypothetical protein
LDSESRVNHDTFALGGGLDGHLLALILIGNLKKIYERVESQIQNA